MPLEEKTIRVKRLRVVADELVVEPGRIIIKRPAKKREEEVLIAGSEEKY